MLTKTIDIYIYKEMYIYVKIHTYIYVVFSQLNLSLTRMCMWTFHLTTCCRRETDVHRVITFRDMRLRESLSAGGFCMPRQRGFVGAVAIEKLVLLLRCAIHCGGTRRSISFRLSSGICNQCIVCNIYIYICELLVFHLETRQLTQNLETLAIILNSCNGLVEARFTASFATCFAAVSLSSRAQLIGQDPHHRRTPICQDQLCFWHSRWNKRNPNKTAVDK